MTPHEWLYLQLDKQPPCHGESFAKMLIYNNFRRWFGLRNNRESCAGKMQQPVLAKTAYAG
jgi:hypothetical protein